MFDQSDEPFAFPEKGNTESTCLAVACGSSLLIYRNMKPYYRYNVPQKDILGAETELWNALKQGQTHKGQLVDGLKVIGGGEMGGGLVIGRGQGHPIRVI